MLQSNPLMQELYRPFVAEDHEFHPFHGFVYLKEEAISTRLSSVLGVTGWDKVITERQLIPAGVPVVKVSKGEILLDAYPGEVVAHDGKYYERKHGTRKSQRAVLDEAGVPVKDGDKVRMETFDEDYDIETDINVVYDVPCVLVHGYLTIRVTNGGIVQEAIRYTTGGDVLTSLGKERGNQLMNTYKSADTDFLKRGARMAGVGLYITELPKGDKSIADHAALEAWLHKEYGVQPVKAAKQRVMDAVKSVYPNPSDLTPIIRRLQITNDDFSFRTQEVIDAILAVK